MNRLAYPSRNLGLAAGLLLCSGLVAAPAMAATITYNFVGTANQFGNEVSPPFTSPSSMSGSMTVNTTDTNSNANNGSYSIESFAVTIGGYTATLGPSGVVDIRNGTGGGPGADRFTVTVNAPTGNNVNFLAARLFEIQLRGPSNLFTNDALPNPVPSVSSFADRNEFRLQFGPGNANARAVSGALTSLTAVPLPTAVILFGVGLVALIGLGAGGRRNLGVPQA